MTKLICYLLLLTSLTAVSQKEAVVNDFRANSFEIYYPSYHFFDNMSFFDNHPLRSLGIAYFRNPLKRKIGWRVATDYFLWGYDAKNLGSPPFGDILSRQVVLVNLGINKAVFSKPKIQLLGFGEFNGKFGLEKVYGGKFGVHWAQIPRQNYDVGLSLGALAVYRFKFGLTFSLSAKQTFYYYVHNTYKHYNGAWYVRPPRNAINVNIGLGWNFGRKRTTPSVSTNTTLKQAANSDYKSHSVTLYSPIYYFFDNPKFGVSTGVGLSYGYNFSERKTGMFFSTEYCKNKDSFDPPIYGNVLSREVLFVNAGIDRKLVERKKIRIAFFGELSGRFGSEVYQTNYVFLNSENQYEQYWTEFKKDVTDFGLSAGVSSTYRFSYGLALNFSVKQSVYYYQYNNQDLSNIISPSRNLIMLNMGIGWNFGKK